MMIPLQTNHVSATTTVITSAAVSLSQQALLSTALLKIFSNFFQIVGGL